MTMLQGVYEIPGETNTEIQAKAAKEFSEFAANFRAKWGLSK